MSTNPPTPEVPSGTDTPLVPLLDAELAERLSQLKVLPWPRATTVLLPETSFEDEEERSHEQILYEVKCRQAEDTAHQLRVLNAGRVAALAKKAKAQQEREKEAEAQRQRDADEAAKRKQDADEAAAKQREQDEEKKKKKKKETTVAKKASKSRQVVVELSKTARTEVNAGARAEEARQKSKEAGLEAQVRQAEFEAPVTEAQVERLGLKSYMSESANVAYRMAIGRSVAVQEKVGSSLNAARNEMVAVTSRKEAAAEAKKGKPARKGKKATAKSSEVIGPSDAEGGAGNDAPRKKRSGIKSFDDSHIPGCPNEIFDEERCWCCRNPRGSNWRCWLRERQKRGEDGCGTCKSRGVKCFWEREDVPKKRKGKPEPSEDEPPKKRRNIADAELDDPIEPAEDFDIDPDVLAELDEPTVHPEHNLPPLLPTIPVTGETMLARYIAQSTSQRRTTNKLLARIAEALETQNKLRLQKLNTLGLDEGPEASDNSGDDEDYEEVSTLTTSLPRPTELEVVEDRDEASCASVHSRAGSPAGDLEESGPEEGSEGTAKA
ncbi:MAG TPA: hypothetical protein VGO47_03875 [Chlamydiales bacterium]|nr:hypothetical protein [Chlamydiales bacterium]